MLKTRVDTDGGEVALLQESVELSSTLNRLDKDADLVEFEIVQQVVELPVLLPLLELEVELLKTVEGQLGLIIDVNFKRLQHINQLARQED